MVNREQIEKACKECLEETKIEYLYDDGFFTPKMKGINYLELGRSKIISNPITIFIEWLYVQYKKIRDFFRRFLKTLFPRRSKLYRGQIDSYLVGRITFAKRQDDFIPIHNMKVEFWARTWWLQWRKLSDGYTDRNGYFKLPFTLRKARNWQNYKTQFEIYQTLHYYFSDHKGKPIFDCIKTHKIPKNNLIGMSYSLNSIQLFYWEYETNTKLPRAAFQDHGKVGPQKYTSARLDALYQQIIPIELTKIKHLDQIKYAPETISLASIQNDYPENLTRCIDRKIPNYSRSDAWFGERMMNGMNRGTFQPDKVNSKHYWLKYFGNCSYDHNDKYALPTTEVKFKLDQHGLPLPIEIILTGPLNAFDKNPWQKHHFYPDSGSDWEAAKRLVRVTGAVSTELDEHFTFTHMNTEQYAIAAYRNLRRNPIANLLLPHLKEVALIDHSADKVILKDFFPGATALTYQGVLERLGDMLGVIDWKGWGPMKAISKGHKVAKADQLFWEITGEFVDTFIADNLAEIKTYWFEIYCFSKDLVKHSAVVFLSNINSKNLPKKERELAENRLAYYRLQYGFNPDMPRKKINGELKILSPITESMDFESAPISDLQNLKDACRYIIMIATYMHTWINEHQYDSLGDLLYNGGGLRFGESKKGVLNPETDLTIGPELSWATKQLFLTNFLSRTEYGFITRNEDHDVNPLFKDLLLAKEKEFAELNVDVNNIESRTNI